MRKSGNRFFASIPLQSRAVHVGVEALAVVVADRDQQGMDVVGRGQPVRRGAGRERQRQADDGQEFPHLTPRNCGLRMRGDRGGIATVQARRDPQIH
jgi:hypothetical protein